MAIISEKDIESISGGAGSKIRWYTVKSGDTLESIAQLYGTTAQYLMTINHISNPELIRAGDKIRVPINM